MTAPPRDEVLDALAAAILAALAESPVDLDVSLPRLSKRLGLGASVLMRQLALMSDAAIAGAAGPGWVRVTSSEGRWTASLTAAGRAQAARALVPRT